MLTHFDSRGRGRWVFARRSERGADPVHTERNQSTRDSGNSQRKDSEDNNHSKSSLNGTNERKGSRTDPNRFDIESAAAVRVEVSDDDIRVVALESIVPTDGHNIQDFRARESTLKRLLKNKKFVKVKSDGDRRYVRKANGRTSSFCSWVRRLLGLGVEEHNQLRVTSRPILMAQNGREDDNKCEVHKNIYDQQKGRKRVVRPVVCDPPLRTVGLLVRENVHKLPIKVRVPIDGQSKRSSAEVFFNRHKSLKESFNRIPYDKECDRIRRMDDSIVEPPIEKPLTEELRMSMCQTVRHCLPLLKSQDIKVYQSIARGGQGLVFYGEGRVENNKRQLAIKVSLSKDDDFTYELAVMRQLSHHDNIIRLFDIGRDKTNSILVLEMAEGDVMQYMRAMKAKDSLPTMETRRQWTKSIANGLLFIHSSGFVHNDLKLQNILIVRDMKSNELVPKISDFGHSRRAVRLDGTPIRGSVRYGTAYYAPPECLLNKDIEDMRLSDVWAFGLLVFQLVIGRNPFPPFSKLDRRDPVKVKARVQVLRNHNVHLSTRGLTNYSPEERTEFQIFIRRLLEPEVSMRENLDRIIEDKWLEDRNPSENSQTDSSPAISQPLTPPSTPSPSSNAWKLFLIIVLSIIVVSVVLRTSI